jgi:thiol-disulfide isomerase/thioredoxin
MLRRLFPVCLTLALWGCNTSPPPAPAGGTAKASGATATRKLTLDAPDGADSNAARKEEAESGTRPKGSSREEETSDEAPSTEQPGGDSKTEKSGAARKKTAKGGVAAALRKLERARTPEVFKSAVEALETALDDEPENLDGLLALAQVFQMFARDAGDDEPTEPLLHKSVTFLERAMPIVKPEVLENEGFRRFTATAYYNDARALAREEKLPEALASLGKAIDFGYMQIEEIQKDKDLSQVRELPEFTTFIAGAEKKIAEAKEKIRIAAEKEVAQLLKENEPFEFDFDLEDVAGKKLSKADLAGKVLIVDIWGTWCPPCRMEIPHFAALDREYREKGLQVVGLNSEGEDDAKAATRQVQEFCEENAVPYPCALVTEEITKQVPEFRAFPTTLFLDRQGTVRLKVVGYHDIPFLRAAVEILLKEKDAAAIEKPADKTSE